MRVSSSATRNAWHSSSGHKRSAHRLPILVKICIADAPIALPRGGASCVPPAMDTCAPSNRASSHTGAIHDGSFALSFFGLNAGRFAARGGAAFLRRAFLARFATAAFATLRFARAFGRAFDAFLPRLAATFLLERFRLAMKRLPAARAMDWPRLSEGIV